MNRSRWIVPLAVAALVGVTAAGCGGGNSGEQAKTTSTTTAKPSTPAPAARPALAKGDAARGRTAFVKYCSACHGPDAKGLPNLGKNLHQNAFIRDHDDAFLHEYVVKGRAADDPLNTTGIPMPPKGGNPALTDAEIMDIIAFLRTLQ